MIKHRTGNTRGIIVIRQMAFVPGITKTFSNMCLGIIGFTELINAISKNNTDRTVVTKIISHIEYFILHNIVF